jgi:hypothetical protein
LKSPTRCPSELRGSWTSAMSWSPPASEYNPEHANQWSELGPAGNIEHETRGAPLRIVITKNWHEDCFRFIPLFDPGTIPSPRPGAQFAAARRRRQGRPSRSRAANSDFAGRTLTVASTAARLRRVGDEADLDRPHQTDHAQHRGIVPSSASRALYSAREVPAGSPSNNPVT